MSGKKLYIFAFLMSFCTSTFVSMFIILLTGNQEIFTEAFIDRLIIAWPTVFFCILFFAPKINTFVNKFFK